MTLDEDLCLIYYLYSEWKKDPDWKEAYFYHHHAMRDIESCRSADLRNVIRLQHISYLIRTDTVAHNIQYVRELERLFTDDLNFRRVLQLKLVQVSLELSECSWTKAESKYLKIQEAADRIAFSDFIPTVISMRICSAMLKKEYKSVLQILEEADNNGKAILPGVIFKGYCLFQIQLKQDALKEIKRQIRKTKGIEKKLAIFMFKIVN